MPLMFEAKSPEDQMILRVKEWIQNLAASATIVTAILVAITAFVAAMIVTALVAIVVMAFVTRSDIHDWCATRHWSIHHDGRATDHGWTIRHRRRTWRVNRDGARGMKDWHGHPKHKPDIQPCLGGACQSDDCNRCNQTEEMFSIHGGSDETHAAFFIGLEYMNIAVCESVRTKEVKNE